MKFTLVPEYRFKAFDDVTVDFLLSLNIKGVLLDIDNTLEPYEHAVAGKNVKDWLAALDRAGIKTAIISNNNSDRVTTFNAEFNMHAYAKAGKPFKRNLLKAMSDIGTSNQNTIFIGDQILTDVWAAHNAGIKAILVDPINDKRDIFTRFKRLIEKPIIRKYEKERK